MYIITLSSQLSMLKFLGYVSYIILSCIPKLRYIKVPRFHLPGKHDTLSWYLGGYKIYQTPQISPTLVKIRNTMETVPKSELKQLNYLKGAKSAQLSRAGPGLAATSVARVVLSHTRHMPTFDRR